MMRTTLVQSPVEADGSGAMPQAYAGLIDVPRLEAWLETRLPDLGAGPLRAQMLTGGKTNAVFSITRGGKTGVLRRPPASPRPSSEKVIAREARVLSALEGSGVPAPRVYAFCDDRSVLGVTFYVMERIEGWLGRHPPPPFDRPGPERSATAYALVEGIAQLARVDYRAVGLEGFGEPEGFLLRQVDRWLAELRSYKQSEQYAGREIPGLAYVTDWLRANVPAMSAPGILHGDYSLANVIFQPEPPARLAAMIDWELSTIGDPLLDLGWLLYAFNDRDQKTPPAGTFDPTDFPYRADLAERYAEVSGRSIENLKYYLILAQFKLGIIMERHYARSLVGRNDPVRGEYSRQHVLRLFAKAEAMARGIE
jgi:aminoglycoside phosphotransferase (APT) family kinase protein